MVAAQGQGVSLTALLGEEYHPTAANNMSDVIGDELSENDDGIASLPRLQEAAAAAEIEATAEAKQAAAAKMEAAAAARMAKAEAKEAAAAEMQAEAVARLAAAVAKEAAAAAAAGEAAAAVAVLAEAQAKETLAKEAAAAASKRLAASADKEAAAAEMEAAAAAKLAQAEAKQARAGQLAQAAASQLAEAEAKQAAAAELSAAAAEETQEAVLAIGRERVHAAEKMRLVVLTLSEEVQGAESSVQPTPSCRMRTRPFPLCPQSSPNGLGGPTWRPCLAALLHLATPCIAVGCVGGSTTSREARDERIAAATHLRTQAVGRASYGACLCSRRREAGMQCAEVYSRCSTGRTRRAHFAAKQSAVPHDCSHHRPACAA